VTTPQGEALRLPAEWEPQSAVLLTWPHAGSDWGPWLDEVETVFATIGAAVTRHQRLLVTCRRREEVDPVRRRLAAAGADPDRIALYTAPSNDVWVRDHGPISVLRGNRPLLLDFIFNGWGNKYPAALDNALTATIHRQGAFDDTPLQRVSLVLEGGSIDSDGHGTLLTTRRCLLSPERNPQYDQAALEAALARWLGAERVLWLHHGHLSGDDTDSHIDTLARFCDPRTIAYTTCDRREDPHHAPLQKMAAELAALRDRDGAPYRLIPLPLPEPCYGAHGERLPATYANFLIINGAVLLPTYRDSADRIAEEQLRAAFPGREVIPIPCLPLIRQYGSLHCVTMQLPAKVLRS